MTTEENQKTESTALALETIQMTTDIVTSFVSNNTVDANDLPGIIQSVHASMRSLGQTDTTATNQKPAVPVSRSVKDDYIVCLEDGAKLKMLKRYIRTRFNLNPDEYRKKWNLPSDYPMVAPAYARHRSSLAKQIGLGKGRKKGKGKAKA
jgi:predicted transcriptional regulator